MEQGARNCQNCKTGFVIDPEDFDFYKKIDVPPPTFCPECRLIRRLSWRNEKSLYRRKCNKCGKQIISVFPDDSGMTVYCNPCWWSDSWDGLEYGMDYDPNRPFILQVKELLQKTPVTSLFGLYTTLENSDYTNMVGHLKNCYLITHSDYSENCAYGSIVDFCKDSVDNLMLSKSELCYQTVNCRECYQSLFSVDCESCRNIFFCENCIGCSDCIGCTNLRNRRYCIFNKEYSKEEYEKIKSGYQLDSSFTIDQFKKKTQAFCGKFPKKFMHERHNLNVSGDYIYNSKNVKDTFIATDTEDSRYCSFITPPRVTNCYDFSHYGDSADLVYDSIQVGNQVSRIKFSWFAITGSQNADYSIFSIGSKNVFGTVSLKRREYCILNKQYSKEKYEELRLKIIDDMEKMPYKDFVGNTYSYGEFFPIELSPFGYNATTAQELFPLTKEQAKQKGYKWKEQEKYDYKITVQSFDIPQTSSHVSDSITSETIACEHGGTCDEQCSTAFKIIPAELAFYKKLNLPLPRLCPNCRHWARLKFRNHFKLWAEKCQCSGVKSENGVYQNTAVHSHGTAGCPNSFETSYASDRPEVVYCEACYNAEVA